MAIIKRKGKNGITYQVKVKASDGVWETKTFREHSDAKSYELRLRLTNSERRKSMTLRRRFSVSEYFDYWFVETKAAGTSKGWRMSQEQMFRDYIKPVIGTMRLQDIIPAHINGVLKIASEKNRSLQTKLHIYNLMHNAFRDAVEVFHLVVLNPVTSRLRPKVVRKEAKHLQLDEVRKLIRYADAKPYALAIWI